jgi:16S rRNA (cytosine967-C5)-methyltransferase
VKNTARVQASRLIAGVLAGKSLQGGIDKELANLPPEERALCRELTYGTLRDWPRLDALLGQLLQKPLRGKDKDIKALLGIGIYQLSHLRIPAHAAVSETVAAVQPMGKGWARGLVNGVLRNFQRRGPALLDQLDEPAAAALPDWLFRRFQCQWPEHMATLATCASLRPPMHLRVNLRRGQRSALLKAIREAGMDGRQHSSVESAIILDQGVDVAKVPGFSDGLVSVQDASAQVAAELLSPDVGETILDACAAPGGKACHLAELMGDDRTLLATDISESRLTRIRENRDRIGASFDIAPTDASAPSLGDRTFDAILADVPCSASGVLRRNPDIKVLRTADDIDRFVQQQKQILAGLWPLLKPAGRLLYATCSILEEENDAVISWAEAHLKGAEAQFLSHPQGIATRRGLQCLPSPEEGDGLYYGLLRKTPE